MKRTLSILISWAGFARIFYGGRGFVSEKANQNHLCRMNAQAPDHPQRPNQKTTAMARNGYPSLFTPNTVALLFHARAAGRDSKASLGLASLGFGSVTSLTTTPKLKRVAMHGVSELYFLPRCKRAIISALIIWSCQSHACDLQIASADQFGSDGTDEISDLIVVGDSEVIIAGNWTLPQSITSGVLAYVRSGVQEWILDLGDSSITSIESICMFSNDGFVFAGSSNRPAVGYKCVVGLVSLSGQLRWLRYYDGLAAWRAFDVVVGVSHEIFVAGGTPFAFDQQDAVVFRLDSLGTLVWATTFGGPWSEHFESLGMTSEGDIVAVGMGTDPVSFESRVLLAKVAATGDSVWSRHIGSAAELRGHCLAIVSSTMYVVGASLQREGLQAQVQVIGVDSNGQAVWTTELGGPFDDRIYDIEITSSNHIVFCGGSKAEQFLPLNADVGYLNINGDTLQNFLLADSLLTIATSLAVAGSCELVLGGIRTGPPESRPQDFYVVRLSEPDVSTRSTTVNPDEMRNISISPNPLSTFCTMSAPAMFQGRTRLSVYDVLGRLIATYYTDSDRNQRTSLALNTVSWAQGFYLVKIEDSQTTVYGNFLVVH